MVVQYFRFANRAEYDSFETAILKKLNDEKKPRERIPPETKYSEPIKHPTNDQVIARFDEKADTTGKTILSEDDAVTQGFLSKPPVLEVKNGVLFIDGKKVGP